MKNSTYFNLGIITLIPSIITTVYFFLEITTSTYIFAVGMISSLITLYCWLNYDTRDFKKDVKRTKNTLKKTYKTIDKTLDKFE
jgi:hypothetical protein